jgi:hypothetical protein
MGYAKPVLMTSSTGTGVLVVPTRLSLILPAHRTARELVSGYRHELPKESMTTTKLNLQVPIMAHTWSFNALTMKTGVVPRETPIPLQETTISPAATIKTWYCILARLSIMA